MRNVFVAAAIAMGFLAAAIPVYLFSCSEPAESPVAVETSNEVWLTCPPNGYHTSDGAYAFSRLPAETVVGQEKFLVWGLSPKAECVTGGSSPQRTDAIVSDGRCWYEIESDDSICQVAQNDLRIVHTCVDGAGKPVPRSAVTDRLNTRRQPVPDHPGVESRCVVGVTDHGCEPKPVAVATNNP